MKYAARLARLEQCAAPAASTLIIVRRTRAGDPTVKLMARLVSPTDGAPTDEAVAALSALVAEGYRVPYGIEGEQRDTRR
ncbi:MAG: hypothetical protein O2973_13750 [Gemmatimonadetes bacterium]|nr:hypothetical protein [Gemmatimonadota bacterium]